MSSIPPNLLSAIRVKTGLSRPQVYRRIQQIAQAEYLPRHLAAIKFGAEVGVAILKHASADDLANLRQAGSPVLPPQPVGGVAIPAEQTAKKARTSIRAKSVTPPNYVFVVHGRDSIARAALFDFLRAIGIRPLEWATAVGLTKKGSPYIGEVLEAAFARVRAVVVLLTPDDIAQLRPDLLSRDDPPYESRLSGQARPNVLFEAGMAFSKHPDRTILVQLGNVRPFSDVAGKHVVRLENRPDKRLDLATRLKNAGCDVDTSGTDWLQVGDFTDPELRKPKNVKGLKVKR